MSQIMTPQKNSRFAELVRQRRANMGRRGLRRKAPRWLYPVAIERLYKNRLLDKVDAYEAEVKRLLLARIPALHAAADVNLRADDFLDDIKTIIASLSVAAAGIFSDAENVAAGIALQVANFNDNQYKKVIRSTLGVDPISNDAFLKTRLKGFAVANAALIKDIPAKSTKDIEGLVIRGLMGGATIRDLQRDIRKHLKSTKARARLIARDQTGKLNAQLAEVRQVRAGVDEYIWNTVDDERVRPSHDELEGKVCKWADPSVYRNIGEAEWRSRSSIGGYIGHPGTDYQCRCFAEPIIEDLIDESE